MIKLIGTKSDKPIKNTILDRRSDKDKLLSNILDYVCTTEKKRAVIVQVPFEIVRVCKENKLSANKIVSNILEQADYENPPLEKINQENVETVKIKITIGSNTYKKIRLVSISKDITSTECIMKIVVYTLYRTRI